jgi:DNA-binding Xre family transcriptional regulator
MRLPELRTSEELLAEQLQTNSDFCAEWERSALGRFIAIEVLRHRTGRGWSQRKLGKVLGMTQPQVARLEAGERTPTFDTLMRISAGLGIELTINVTPSNRRPRLVTKRARTANAVGEVHTDQVTLLVAVG